MVTSLAWLQPTSSQAHGDNAIEPSTDTLFMSRHPCHCCQPSCQHRHHQVRLAANDDKNPCPNKITCPVSVLTSEIWGWGLSSPQLAEKETHAILLVYLRRSQTSLTSQQAVQAACKTATHRAQFLALQFSFSPQTMRYWCLGIIVRLEISKTFDRFPYFHTCFSGFPPTLRKFSLDI